MSATSADIDIRILLDMVWNKRYFVLGTFLIGLCLTYYAVSLMGSRFTASSLVLLKNESTQSQVEELISRVRNANFDIGFILTELEVIKSRTLAAKVVKKLDLMNDKEFNKSSNNHQNIRAQNISQQNSFKNLYVNGAELKTLKPEIMDHDVAETVTNFLDRLSASAVPGSLAVKVSFSSRNPQKAAYIANAVVEEYLLQRLEGKAESERRLVQWLNKRQIALREQVLEAEKKVQEFIVENNLVSGKRDTLTTEQLSALNAELVEAERKYLDAKLRMQQATKNSATANNTNAALVKQLELDRIRLKAEQNELANRYGAKHPAMTNKNAEIVELDKKINEEFGKVRESLKNEVSIARARVEDIKKDLKEATSQQREDGGAMITLRELEREAKATQMVLKTFIETYKKTLGREDLQEPGAQVLSYASVPHETSSPDKSLILTLGAFVSFLIGLVVALFAEKLDTRLRTIEDIESVTGMKCCAEIPYVRGVAKNGLTKYIQSNPSAPITEAVRSLYVELDQDEKSSKVFAFVSPNNKEGKTTLATLTAAAIAKAGRNVVLIDADLRRSGVAKAVKQSPNATLVEFLTGHKNVNEVISKDSDTGLDIIFGQAVPNTAFDILNSQKMKALIVALREKYDFVIIDTPASSEVSDAKILSRYADQNVYIANWNKTTDESIDRAMKYFRDIPRSEMRLVLNKVK